MKILFMAIALLLAGASIGIYGSYPELHSELPVIYWVTDPNPAREEQVAIFHRWLIKNHYGETVTLTSADDARGFLARNWPTPIVAAMREANPRGPDLWNGDLRPVDVEHIALPLTVVVPLTELKLDTANRDQSKQIIQSVSGVAGDIMDMGPLHYFVELGVLEDVTTEAKEMGFSTEQTFAAIEPDLTVHGRQYGFPCNVYAQMLWANKATLTRYGIPAPPRRWTVEEFESLGKQFVAAANPPDQPHRYFFANDVPLLPLMRSTGLSMFNETLTRSTLADERFAETLRRLYKWTYDDRLLPSLADRQSFDTQSGYGGANLQLFNNGNYALLGGMGRYALIQLRKFGQLDLAVAEPPHAGFPNTATGTRCAAIYVGGQPDLAKYFLAYLASEDYNMQVVRDADALPPNPKYTEVEEYLRPPDYPSEWGLHEAFSEAAENIAIAAARTPFGPDATVSREFTNARDAVLVGGVSPEEAAREAAERINAVIARTVAEDPRLEEQYKAALARQEQIDQRRAAGKPVPLEWIANPFHRHYYQTMGWAE